MWLANSSPTALHKNAPLQPFSRSDAQTLCLAVVELSFFARNVLPVGGLASQMAKDSLARKTFHLVRLVDMEFSG